MTVRQTPPSLEEFLIAPTEDVAQVAPTSLILALSGTRRRAALAGTQPLSKEYRDQAREELIGSIELLFRYGVRNILAVAVVSGNLAEYASFREAFLQWVAWGMIGPETLADYHRHGWRVRLIGGEDLPELRPVATQLDAATAADGPQTLWWYVVDDPETPLRTLLAAARQHRATTRAEAMRALYGEEIDPATLFLSFGKPIISYELLPPLLLGQVHTYWMQYPGYHLPDIAVRRILYDYAYVRPTNGLDRGERYTDMSWQRDAWENQTILGVGQRLGGFWYPADHPVLHLEGKL